MLQIKCDAKQAHNEIKHVMKEKSKPSAQKEEVNVVAGENKVAANARDSNAHPSHADVNKLIIA